MAFIFYHLLSLIVALLPPAQPGGSWDVSRPPKVIQSPRCDIDMSPGFLRAKSTWNPSRGRCSDGILMSITPQMAPSNQKGVAFLFRAPHPPWLWPAGCLWVYRDILYVYGSTETSCRPVNLPVNQELSFDAKPSLSWRPRTYECCMPQLEDQNICIKVALKLWWLDKIARTC